MKKSVLLLGSAVLASAFAGNAAARDGISVVGSSTVYPFATVVAERFGKTTDFSTPKIESTGSGGGLKLFCSGIGVDTPDITNASRRMKTSEYEMCQENGVTDIVEVLIGFDGIAVANSINAEQFDMGTKELYLALAKMVPNPDGSESLVENPYKQWSEINPELPATDIEVLGPPPTSGTRDAFAELAMEGGCKQFEFIKGMEDDDFKATCHTMREDGAYIEAGENDNLIVQKLEANPDALGIFGFSFLEQNSDKVQSSVIDGYEADFDAIASGDYGISRPLYFYVKAQHIGTVPGIAEYLAEFTSEQAWGEDGYLADKGMIPLGDEQRAEVGAAVKSLQKLVLN
ncbi:substrate-binding domain-containing protein [Granulosicoccus sp. 3-233]|uniref:substrate-binding domain-containing protein n=1 Tax=Granulosicoccus sp. 3-233 TaxID=3417969 RepID=UPI003D35597F